MSAYYLFERADLHLLYLAYTRTSTAYLLSFVSLFSSIVYYLLLFCYISLMSAFSLLLYHFCLLSFAYLSLVISFLLPLPLILYLIISALPRFLTPPTIFLVLPFNSGRNRENRRPPNLSQRLHRHP